MIIDNYCTVCGGTGHTMNTMVDCTYCNGTGKEQSTRHEVKQRQDDKDAYNVMREDYLNSK